MLSFFPRGVLDEILNLIESVSEDFPSYSHCLQMSLKRIFIDERINLETHFQEECFIIMVESK